MSNLYIFNWTDMAFGSKSAVKSLHATFVLAPRTMTNTRLTQIVKSYLPKGNIVIGISEEPYVLGFEDQPQFRMLMPSDVLPLVKKVHASKLSQKVYILNYSQRDITHIIEKLNFQHVVLVNGSWKHSFHTLPAFYSIIKSKLSYEYISPFASETEAKQYDVKISREISRQLNLPANGVFSEAKMEELARLSAKQSFDNSGQTGAALGKRTGKNYRLLGTSCNEVVPFKSFAMHFGASREQHFTPPNDLNHYDTVHAEVVIVMAQLRAGRSLNGTTLFVNVLPCPVCSRVIVGTEISEVVYIHDHSEGYAFKMLGEAGIKVRRATS